MTSVLIVGTGLIGSSIGLALHGHRRVLLTDTDEDRLAHAIARGAGERWDGSATVELAVVAVPPAATSAVLVDLLRREVSATLTHVAGSQARVQRDLEAADVDLSMICGGHPLA